MGWSWNGQLKTWTHSTGAVSGNPRDQPPAELEQKIIAKEKPRIEFDGKYWIWLVKGLEGVVEMVTQAAVEVPPPEFIKRRIFTIIRKLEEIK